MFIVKGGTAVDFTKKELSTSGISSWMFDEYAGYAADATIADITALEAQRLEFAAMGWHGAAEVIDGQLATLRGMTGRLEKVAATSASELAGEAAMFLATNS